MSQIDSRIALGVQPAQVENPMNALARVMQVKALQQQSEANALTMQEKQRSIAEGNALANVYRTPGFSWENEAHRNSAFSAAPSKAQELYKGYLEIEGKKGENKKRDYDLNKERFGVVRRAAAAFANDPNASRDRVISTLQAYQVGGVIPEHLATQFAQSLPEDPVQLREVLMNFAKQDLTSEQLFTLFAPKPTQVDNGQQISYRDTNPNSPTYGQTTAGGVVQKLADPGAVLSAQTSTANNQRSVAAQRDIAQATRDAAATNKQAAIESARIQTGFQNEQGLRKEFEALPEVKKYKQAVPSYKGIEDAVKRNTAQSDINIVYGIAKLYDPDSVVREGEYATVANSPNIPDRIKGYAQYIAGGGRLTPKVKGEILAEARSRMASFENEFVAARRNFESIANRSQVDTTRVFPAPHTPALSVDLNSLPSGSGGGGKPKVVDFGSLK